MRSIYMVFMALLLASCASESVNRRPADILGGTADYTTSGGTLAEKPEYLALGECHPFDQSQGDISFGGEIEAWGILKANPRVKEMDARTRAQYARLAYVLQLEKPVFVQTEAGDKACRVEQLTLELDRSQTKRARLTLSSGQRTTVKGTCSLPMSNVEIMSNAIVREAVFTSH